MKGFFQFGSPFIVLMINGREISLLLDTGFNGHIMLPYLIIKKLGLKQIGSSDYVTASGDSQIANVYIGKLLFFDKEMEVPILSTHTNFSLVGMDTFHNSKVVIERSKDIIDVSQSLQG